MSRSVPAAARDVGRIFVTRAVRLFAYGFVSVALVVHLDAAALSESRAERVNVTVIRLSL